MVERISTLLVSERRERSLAHLHRLTMARKKVHKQKPESTLVPHRTPNLSVLLDIAKSGDAAQAMKAYLDAGGTAGVLVSGRGVAASQQLPLLHHMAKFNSHLHRELAECVRLLVRAGADINAMSGPNDRTALMRAAEACCCTQVLQAFMQNGAEVTVRSKRDKKTALHLAAAAGRATSCDLLLAREHSLIHMKDSQGCTALMYAVASGSVNTVRVLHQHGADVNAFTNIGMTPLVAACLKDRVSMAAYLIEAGADVNAEDCEGYCATMTAVQHNSFAVLQLLLDCGADIHASNERGNLLMMAARAGHVHTMELLEQRGLSIHTAHALGGTLLMLAAQNGHKLAAEWLLSMQKTCSVTLHCTVPVEAAAMTQQLLQSYYWLMVLT
jgi:ankyrin repeat protein